MKLTGNLKTQVESAATKEEKREAIKQAGMLLTDDELDKVSGGDGNTNNKISYTCPYSPGCPKFGTRACHEDSCPWAQGLI